MFSLILKVCGKKLKIRGMKFILVECYLDRYFIHKLLNDNSRIHKATNKNEVLKKIAKDKTGSHFLIGIVDYDREDIIQNSQLRNQQYSFELIHDGQKFKLYKGTGKPHFLFTFNPSAIEYWLIDILEVELMINLTAYNISGINEFQKLKTNSEKLDERIQNMIRDILVNKENSPTLVAFEEKLKYLIEKQFDSNLSVLY